MKIISLLLLLLILYVNGQQQQQHKLIVDPPRGTIDTKLLESASNVMKNCKRNSKIKVIYTEAPLSKATMNDTLAQYDLYHGGLFFKCNDKHIVGFEYNALNGVGGTLLPTADNKGILQYDKDRDELIWDNGGRVLYLDKMDKKYWTKYHEIAEITKSQFTKTLRYISKFTSYWNRYRLFEVDSLKKGKRIISEPSSTCVDYVFRTLKWMKHRAKVCFKAKELPKRVYVTGYDQKSPREYSLKSHRNRKKLQLWFIKVLKAKAKFDAEASARHSNGTPSTKLNPTDLLKAKGLFEHIMKELKGEWYVYVNPEKVQQIYFNPQSPIKYVYKTDTNLFNENNKHCKTTTTVTATS